MAISMEREQKHGNGPAGMCSRADALKLHIGEGKEINIELLLGELGDMVSAGDSAASIQAEDIKQEEVSVQAESGEERVRRTLKNYTFPVTDVRIGNKTDFANGELTVRESLVAEA